VYARVQFEAKRRHSLVVVSRSFFMVPPEHGMARQKLSLDQLGQAFIGQVYRLSRPSGRCGAAQRAPGRDSRLLAHVCQHLSGESTCQVVHGISRDDAAVSAACSFLFSTGTTEGHATRPICLTRHLMLIARLLISPVAPSCMLYRS